MVLPLIVLIISLVLIYLEFYLPGGVMGIAGGILFILSLLFFAIQSETWPPVLVFAVSAFIVLAVMIRFVLWRIRSKRGDGSIYHNDDQEGYHAVQYNREFIGKEAEVVSDLKPSGHIDIDGQRYQAVAQVGYINKGEIVEVISGEGAHYIVAKKNVNVEE